MATFLLFRYVKLIWGMLFLLGVIYCTVNIYINVNATNNSSAFEINSLPIFLSNWALTKNN